MPAQLAVVPDNAPLELDDPLEGLDSELLLWLFHANNAVIKCRGRMRHRFDDLLPGEDDDHTDVYPTQTPGVCMIVQVCADCGMVERAKITGPRGFVAAYPRWRYRVTNPRYKCPYGRVPARAAAAEGMRRYNKSGQLRKALARTKRREAARAKEARAKARAAAAALEDV